MSGEIIMPDRNIGPSLTVQIDASSLVKMLYQEFKKVAFEYEKEIEVLRARVAELESK